MRTSRNINSKFNLFDLNYTDNLINYYDNFAQFPGFVLLESTDKKSGRYDILSACPYNYLKLGHEHESSESIYNKLQTLIPQQTSELGLPFQGGAIGYFSYDFAMRLAGISSDPQPSLKTLPLIEIGLYDWAIISDHHLKKVYLFAANTQKETAELVKEMFIYWQKGEEKKAFWQLATPFMPLINKIEYRDAFNAIHQELQRGRAYQVNYTQPFNAFYKGDAWAIYRKLRASNPVPYSAFIRSSAAEILSFSPERFLMMDNRQLLTSPIKGTVRRSNNLKEDEILRKELGASHKNKAENVMIVDLLRNDLGKIAEIGSVQVAALCETESYQSVHHLVSHIKGVCRESLSSFDAFGACFPGGSITGAPKLESMRIIAEQERYARGIYCGCIGYFSGHGRFDTNIAIRTLIAREEILHLAAGGGIVIDSQCEAEYEECFTKIAPIIKGLT